MIGRWTCAVLVLTILGTWTHADDWPQFRGLQRDGVSRETGLLKTWSETGPRLAWRISTLGLGYSGPAVVGDRLYICGTRDNSEVVLAHDIKMGRTGDVKELWAAKIGPVFTWKGNNWNMGPNASPTVDGELLFALGGFGDLVCFETATGKERWRKNLPKDLGGEVNPIGGGAENPTPLGWGYAWAPLVAGDHLICMPGGSKGLLAALDKKTGEVVWQSKEVVDQASYSSTIPATIGGVKQYVQVVNSGIVGIAAKDGKLLWRYVRDPAYDDVVIVTPIVHDGHIFSSVGFQQGCDLIKVVADGSGFKVEKIMSGKAVDVRDGGVVLVDGRLYGYSENRGWFCMEFKTGKIVWDEKRKLGRGMIMAADGMLYCVSEKGGTIALIEPNARGWSEKARFKVERESAQRRPSGGLWTHPVVANGMLYIRDQELLHCYQIKK